jgi:uncharacterized protein YrrD
MDVLMGSQLLGLPVLAGPRLRRIGRVQEVLLTRDAGRVCGLALDGGGWPSPRAVLDFQAIRAIGESYVLAEERYLTEEDGARCCREFRGLPILTAGGAEVGSLDDFQFDPETGRVTGLQVSRGFIDDLLSGKEIVALAGPLYAGEAAILLDGPGALER